MSGQRANPIRPPGRTVGETLSWLALALFWLTTLVLGLYGVHLLVLMLLFARRAGGRRAEQARVIAEYRARVPEPGWPRVTTQIPLYNEAGVAERVIDAVAEMDYPDGRHEVQVLDDSSDHTRQIVDAAAARWRARGIDVQVIRRTGRTAYKAGALALGLTQARGELIAVFDADFVPPPEFLRRIVPLIASDARLACVQARWDHLNRDESWLTRAQGLGLDVHFGIEQGARAWNGLLMNFNGTGGMWRKAAIIDPRVGGWSGDTLTEDLDLSYRAQLAGWRMDYCVDLACPAELPGDVWALKSQQRRWATGSIQVARKLLPSVWRARLALRAKVESTIHLTQHSAALAMVVLAVLAAPVRTASNRGGGWYLSFWIAWLVLLLAAIGPWVTHAYARYTLSGRWRGAGLVPGLMIVGMGMAVSNALAVVRGLVTNGGEFVRTPKSGSLRGVRRPSPYAALQNRLWIIELLMGVYTACCLVAYANSRRWVFSFFLLLYAVGFLTMGWMSRPRRRRTAAAADGIGTPVIYAAELPIAAERSAAR